MSITESSTQELTIDRIECSEFSDSDFRKHYRGKRPFILTSALSTLSPQTYDLDNLGELLGDEQFYVRIYGEHRFNQPKQNWDKYCDSVSMTVSQYSQLIKQGKAAKEHMYLAYQPITNTNLAQPIIDALEKLPFELDPATELNIWLGPAGHTTPLHWDSNDGTLLQTTGSKKLILFPPSQSRNLYPFSIFQKTFPPWFSQVHPQTPDFLRFPRLKTALDHKLEIVLQAQELLYIPAFWWHEVTSLGDSYTCSFNRFWHPKPRWRSLTNRRGVMISVLAAMVNLKRQISQIYQPVNTVDNLRKMGAKLSHTDSSGKHHTQSAETRESSSNLK
ncbi:MAG: cupin-like domain-containing protein [Gammaproteobacteria bacterium]|nr:cupin-like domain-containing protein [Gammaproteobacteria bacterium]